MEFLGEKLTGDNLSFIFKDREISCPMQNKCKEDGQKDLEKLS